MFELANNEEIGQYLKTLIGHDFKSVREFCAKYLETIGVSESNNELDNMCNRLSQIINGKKLIQIRDLSPMTQLLHVSCEDILSAGRSRVINTNRLTNYNIASINNKKIWETYLNANEQPFLHCDEYRKNVIDYALEFKNYDLLQYLMREGYIWFVHNDFKTYTDGDINSFGAGTSITSKYYEYDDDLKFSLRTKTYLRTKLIVLAIEHKDLNMLYSLRAREIPAYYALTKYPSLPINVEKLNNNDMVMDIAKSSTEIIDYFTESYEVNINQRCNTFLFPYICELLKAVITTKNRSQDLVLKKAIKHNKSTYEQMLEYHKKVLEDYSSQMNIENAKDNSFYPEIWYDENGSIIRCYFHSPSFSKWYTTNIIHTDCESNEPHIMKLINELNDLYQRILAFNSSLIRK